MDNKGEDSLQKWAQIVNAETVFSMVATAYGGMLRKTSDVERFTTWLLAGTGASAALVVANVGSVTDAVGRQGVTWLLSLLICSIVFGLLARSMPVFYLLDVAAIEAGQQKLLEVLRAHGEQRKEIEKVAAAGNRPPPPTFQMADFATEFLSGVPGVVRFFAGRKLAKLAVSGRRLAEFHMSLRGWTYMVQLCVIQVVAALSALVSVAYHVSAA